MNERDNYGYGEGISAKEAFDENRPASPNVMRTLGWVNDTMALRDRYEAALTEIVRIYNDDSLSNAAAQDLTFDVASQALNG